MSFANKLVNTRGINILVQKKVWTSAISRVRFGSKTQFWFTLFFSKWTKIEHSNYLKVDQNRNLIWNLIWTFEVQKSLFLSEFAILVHCQIARICNFGPFRKEMKWMKIAYSNKIKHAILNSSKFFLTEISTPAYEIIWTKNHLFRFWSFQRNRNLHRNSAAFLTVAFSIIWQLHNLWRMNQMIVQGHSRSFKFKW